jgi:CoA:oxalate CoA-transferase
MFHVSCSPLKGVLVLDFSQFLAGPAAAMRLADLGARVIKIERPGTGDICRQLYISNLGVEGDSTLFHSINRNKQGYAANLKDPADLEKIRHLIAKADVLIENFRPGVMDKLGLGYEAVRASTHASFTAPSPAMARRSMGWQARPGPARPMHVRPHMAQRRPEADGPVPMGLAVADLTASAHLVQGILACLVRRGVTNEGGRVEVSLSGIDP